MKSIITLLLTIILIIDHSKNINAQVANYAFSQSMGTYTTITANTNASSTGVVPQWSGSTGTSTRIQNIGLPFPICYNGVSQNVVSQHSNGYIQFSSSISPNTTSTPISTLNNSISAFGADLEAAGTSSFGARISGIQIGNAPFRYIIFQWGYASLASSMWRRVGLTNDLLHFQIYLYETTNVIETRYYITQARPSSAVTGVEVGLRGASASDFNNRMMSIDALWMNNNVPGSGVSSTMRFGNGTAVKPNHNTSGQQCLIFRWTPQYDPVGSPQMTNCYFSPLPVELSEFTGETGDKINKLLWTTTTEYNSDYFIVEHSLNGGEWYEVGRVNSIGNSTTPVNYELDHRAFVASTYNFYRLKQVDIDGKTKTYNMIFIDNRDSKKDLVKTVNLMGQEVGPFYQGMVIDIYSDGTTEKYYKQ